MANPIVRRSVENATGTDTGSPVDSLAHYHVGLFVAVDGDVTSLAVQLEVSPDGDRWALAEGSTGALEITESDLNEDPTSGEQTASIATPAMYGTQFRVRITEYDGTGTVDAYIMSAGNAGQGSRPTARKGPASDL